MNERKIIPIREQTDEEQAIPGLEASKCAGGEPYALMVLGDSMLPEFVEGEIIVVEPEGVARDGSYVVAWANEEYIFRQLANRDGGWLLRPLNATYENIPIDNLDAIKGVVIMKKQPGRRREAKSYV
jgi:SOS-response transcriptional repressor LexA